MFLVQFAYRLLPSTPHRRWEAAVALVLTLANALYDTGFALVRQSRCVQKEVLFRAPEMDYLLLVTLPRAPLVLLRAFLAQVRAENRPSLWRAILYPHTRPARAVGAILAGVHRLDEGKLDVCVPVRSRDEIGYLTQSFNAMASWLSLLINSREKRVAQRTAALAAANHELGRWLEEIRQLHSRLREEAIRDPLTCLLNRRVLNETLDGQLA